MFDLCVLFQRAFTPIRLPTVSALVMSHNLLGQSATAVRVLVLRFFLNCWSDLLVCTRGFQQSLPLIEQILQRLCQPVVLLHAPCVIFSVILPQDASGFRVLGVRGVHRDHKIWDSVHVLD